jgi:RND superfamily putative drug exporter
VNSAGTTAVFSVIPAPARRPLVPSVMALLGEHAWWMPGLLEPLVPNLQLEGSAPVAAAPPAPPPKAAL